MDTFEIVALVATGLFAGWVGGLLGVGGSIILIPAMTELLGPDQHLYQAAAMIVNFFVVVPAVFRHIRAEAVDRAKVMRLVPVAAVAVVVGVGMSEAPLFRAEGEVWLRGLFGLFLFCFAGADLLGLLRRGRSEPAPPSAGPAVQGSAVPMRWRVALLVAVPTGMIAGLLGVGGGVLAVPLQRRFLRIPMRAAIANSAAVIVATSLIGATAKNYAYMVDHAYSLRSFGLAAVLIPTAILGSLAGSKLTHRAPVAVVKTAFLVLLLVAAVRLTYKAARALPPSATALTIAGPAGADSADPCLPRPVSPGQRPSGLNSGQAYLR